MPPGLTPHAPSMTTGWRHATFRAVREAAGRSMQLLDPEPGYQPCAPTGLSWAAPCGSSLEQAGIRQFIDIGSGIPTAAQRARGRPASRAGRAGAVRRPRSGRRGRRPQTAAAGQPRRPRSSRLTCANPSESSPIPRPSADRLRRPSPLMLVAVLHFSAGDVAPARSWRAAEACARPLLVLCQACSDAKPELASPPKPQQPPPIRRVTSSASSRPRHRPRGGYLPGARTRRRPRIRRSRNSSHRARC